MAFGERLRELREKRGYRQEDVGTALRLGKSAVSQWEAGKRLPDLETVRRLAEFFDVTTDYLIGHTPGLDRKDNEWTPERRAILEELKRDDMTSTMFRSVMEGRRMNEIPDEDMLTVVKLIQFLREKNRKGGPQKPE